VTGPYALKVVEEGLGSGRKVCRVLSVPRSSYWYVPKEKTPWEKKLLKRLMELSDKHPRYEYRRIAVLLRRDGWERRAKACPEPEEKPWAESTPHQEEDRAKRHIERVAAEGGASRACVDMGFYLRCHDPRRIS
jgi:hypothetical protein